LCLFIGLSSAHPDGASAGYHTTGHSKGALAALRRIVGARRRRAIDIARLIATAPIDCRRSWRARRLRPVAAPAVRARAKAAAG